MGIILSGGEIRLRLADPIAYTCHKEWVRRDQFVLNDICGAFSIIVTEGLVTAFFPMSELNQPPDYSLAEATLDALISRLPISQVFKVLRC